MPLARTHYIIGLTPNHHPQPDLGTLEAEIAAAARTWRDRFDEVLRQAARQRLPTPARAHFLGAFPPGYQDQFSPEEAMADLEMIETMSDGRPVQVRAYRALGDPDDGFRFKLYRYADRREHGAEGAGGAWFQGGAPRCAAGVDP
jgi:glutamate dehydrogenase